MGSVLIEDNVVETRSAGNDATAREHNQEAPAALSAAPFVRDQGLYC